MGARERVTELASVNVGLAIRAVAEVGRIGRRHEPALSSGTCRNCGNGGARERAIVPGGDDAIAGLAGGSSRRLPTALHRGR